MKPASFSVSLNLSQSVFTHSLQARIKKYTVGISSSSDSFEAKCLVKGNWKDTNIPYEWSAQLVPSLFLTFNTTGIQWNQSIILLIYILSLLWRHDEINEWGHNCLARESTTNDDYFWTFFCTSLSFISLIVWERFETVGERIVKVSTFGSSR